MYRSFIIITAVIFNFGCSRDQGSFIDGRDGHEYGWVRVGSQIWMSENLAYLPEIHAITDNSVDEPRYYVYGNSSRDIDSAKKFQMPGNNTIDSINVYNEFGVLYNWPAIADGQNPGDKKYFQGVCPAGWHVPSDKEWMRLESTLGMDNLDVPAIGLRSSGDVSYLIKSTSMWENAGTGIDSVGLNLKPSGKAYTGTEFTELYRKAIFWSATPDINNHVWTREVNCCDNGIIRRSRYVEDGYAVRCIKD